MKIQSITTSNFLGARAVDVKLTKTVALFAGKNGAGKSSIQEAVRMALTGETVRVALKKDYGNLITDDQESGFAAVECGNAGYEAVLPSGKGNHCDHAALPYVLDAQRFSRMTDNERRSFLFGLMGVKLDGPAVKLRLLDKGCDAGKAEQIAPILRAGFDAAAKEAASKARDAKASWKTVTGGETWGKDKAGKWQPAPLPEGSDTAAADLDKAKAVLQSITGDLDVALQTLGAANASQRQIKEAHEKRAGLEAIAANVERYTTKLNLDTAELATWEQKVADCKAKAGVAQPDPKAPGEFLLRGLASVTQEFLTLTCDSQGLQGYQGNLYAPWSKFGELINRAATHVSEFQKLHGEPTEHNAKPDQEAIAKLPEYENALRLMQSSVANGKRNLEAAQIAVAQLKALDELKATAVDCSEVEATVNALQAKRKEAQAGVERLREAAEKVTRRAAQVDQAAKLHADVLAWTAIADALAPDGIPAELLAEALGPINDRLAVTAESAQWPRIEITADMQIRTGLHERTYALLSESEKWRTDAMIAEAISNISGVKLLVLDRYDVLDGQGREDALYWLDDLAEAGEIDTALLFGTLKALPAHLLPNIEGFWIENGVTGDIKEAA